MSMALIPIDAGISVIARSRQRINEQNKRHETMDLMETKLDEYDEDSTENKGKR